MAAPATLSVFNILRGSDGVALANEPVRCVLNGQMITVVATGDAILAVQQLTTTDANGRYAFTVVGNDLLSPANTTYTIIEPNRTYDIAPQSTNGATQQTTAANVIVNTPATLAPATSNITGALAVAGLLTAQAGLAVTGGTTTDTLTLTSGGISMPGPLTLTTTTSRIVPGATSLSLRNTANSADNLLITDAGVATVRAGLTVTAGGLTVTAGGLTVTAGGLTVTAGALTFGTAAAKIIPGATSISHRNVADSADNLLISDAGLVTVRAGLTVTASDITATAGRLVFGAATAKVVPGATSISLRNNADNADNLLIADAGAVTFRGGVSINGSGVQQGAGTLGYAQATGTQSGITTQTDVTSCTVTVTVASGRRVRITGFSMLASTVTDDISDLIILQDSVQVMQSQALMRPATGSVGVTATVVLTPSAASHVYKLAVVRAAGTGTISINGASTQPSFILVEDIGT